MEIQIAISDMMIEWFPLVSLVSFLTTGILNEARTRGLMKLGRPLKKSETIVIVLFLSYNIILFLPISFFILFLNPTGNVALILDWSLLVVLVVRTAFPMILFGIISYGICYGLYRYWGITIALSGIALFGMTIFVLNSAGLIESVLPMIFDSVIDLINTGLTYISMMLLLVLCVSDSCQKKDEDNTRGPSKRISAPSIHNTVRLVIGLGRRLVEDNDSLALEALSTVSVSNKQAISLFKQVERELSVDLSGYITQDSDSQMDKIAFFKQSYGNFKRPVIYILYLLFPILIVSAIYTIYSLIAINPLGLLFSFPVVFICLFLLMAAQYLSKFEKGRYDMLPRSQYASYLLTKRGFDRRVAVQRTLLVFSLLILFILTASSLLDFTSVSISLILVCSTSLVIGIIYARTDRFVKGTRLEIDDIIQRSLEYIGATSDSEEADIGQVAEDEYLKPIQEEIVEATKDWKSALDQRGFSKFREKLEKGSREIYQEETNKIFYLGIGAMLTFFGFLTYAMFSSSLQIISMDIFSVVTWIIGIPLLLYGLYTYIDDRSNSRFHGITRKQLGVFLTHCDQRANNVTAPGSIRDQDAPQEYALFAMFHWALTSITRVALIQFGNRVPWPLEEVEMVKKTRLKFPILETLGVVISLTVFIAFFIGFDSTDFPYIGGLFILLIHGMILFIVLSMFYALAKFIQERKAIISFLQDYREYDSSNYKATLEESVSILNEDFSKPVRILVLGKYPGIYYTGKKFFTTTGLELNEAVIIPER